MRKTLLLLSAFCVTLSASAQQSASSVVQLQPKDGGSENPLPIQARFEHTPVNNDKTTASKVRYYNYVEHLGILNGSVLTDGNYNSAPYMWFNPDAMGMYTSGLDTITLCSIGTVLHTFWSRFNGTFEYPNGTMVVTNTNTYTVDSISIAGYYGRNNSKTSVVDTLRVAYTYGDGTTATNVHNYYYTGAVAARYGTDTVRSLIPAFDLVRHTMYKATGSTGPAIMIKDILLRSTDTGSKEFGIAAGLSVPAGNLVAATFTFRSGDAFVPYDTVFRGSTVNPTNPFKYGMFRPYIYYENLSGTNPGFPTYTKGNYNAGQFERLPETDPQNTATYSPNWAWSTNNGSSASSYQFPYITWKISCPSCRNLGIESINDVVSVGNPYPNPANTTISVPVSTKSAATVNATLRNILGQTITAQTLGAMAALQTKTVDFNTSHIPNGVYLLIVEANGEQLTKRIAISH